MLWLARKSLCSSRMCSLCRATASAPARSKSRSRAAFNVGQVSYRSSATARCWGSTISRICFCTTAEGKVRGRNWVRLKREMFAESEVERAGSNTRVSPSAEWRPIQNLPSLKLLWSSIRPSLCWDGTPPAERSPSEKKNARRMRRRGRRPRAIHNRGPSGYSRVGFLYTAGVKRLSSLQGPDYRPGTTTGVSHGRRSATAIITSRRTPNSTMAAVRHPITPQPPGAPGEADGSLRSTDFTARAW